MHVRGPLDGAPTCACPLCPPECDCPCTSGCFEPPTLSTPPTHIRVPQQDVRKAVTQGTSCSSLGRRDSEHFCMHVSDGRR